MRKKPKIIKPKKSPKILLYDIESTALTADWGFMLCFGYKWLGESKTKVIGIHQYPGYNKDRTCDKELCKDVHKIISEADAVVTWYGSRFDHRFLNTRMLLHDLPPLPNPAHIDGWRLARRALKLRSNRLQNVARFFGLEDKTPITGEHWRKAIAGYKKSLKYVTDHCYQDIETLEQAFMKLRPVMTTQFNFSLYSDKEYKVCPNCKSKKIQKRGTQTTRAKVVQRYHCQSCGAWFKGSRSLMRAEEL